MDELLNKIEARGEQRGILIGEQRGIGIGEQRGDLKRARAAALGMRAVLGISDPELVAKAIGIEAELIERWFAEEPDKP